MFFPPRPAPVLTVRAEGRFAAPSCSAQHHWPTILELVAHCGHAKKPGDESRSMKLLIAGDNSPFQETILEAVTFSFSVLFSFPFSAPYPLCSSSCFVVRSRSEEHTFELQSR